MGKSVNLNSEERQNTFFLKIKMLDNKLAEFDYKVPNIILQCGELFSKWDNSVRSVCSSSSSSNMFPM